MKFKSKYLGILILMVVQISCSKEEKKSEPVAVKVDIQKISKSKYPQELTYTGTIEPENTAQVGFSLPGVINHIAVEEGQTIKEGQLLASIDATEYQNALSIANASLEQAEDLFNRLNGLYEKGSLPAKDYIDIKTKVTQAKANKSINSKHIQDSRLVAPIAGIITSKLIERGSVAAPGVPAFVIVKTDIVYVRITVPETEVGALKKGMEAHVFIPTIGDTLKGKVTIINPMADAISKTYTVKIKLINSNGQLLPGMLATTKINTGKHVEVVSVPATAVVRDADAITYLFVSNAENKAIRKRIKIDKITGENQLIVEGLQEGDRVVVKGQSRLKEGSTLIF